MCNNDRQQHIGSSKSVVAAERVRLIGARKTSNGIPDVTMRIHPLTVPMEDSASSSAVFNHRFWGLADVVLTALVRALV